MFTPSTLLALAIDHEVRANLLCGLENGVAIHQRYEAMRAMDDAFNTALWMENHGIQETRSVGPYGNLPIMQGEQVKVPKGTKLNGRDEARTTYRVMVITAEPGVVFQDNDGRVVVRNQKVVWRSHRGDWRSTEATQVVRLAA